MRVFPNPSRWSRTSIGLSIPAELRRYALLVNEELPKATDYVASWITAHRDEVGWTEIKFVRQDKYGRTLCAEFETAEHLIQFYAWDHASCLDILALDRATGAEAYTSIGECDGVVALAQRLDTFLHWLNVNEPNRNA